MSDAERQLYKLNTENCRTMWEAWWLVTAWMSERIWSTTSNGKMSTENVNNKIRIRV